MLNAPVLVRSLKLSNIEPSHSTVVDVDTLALDFTIYTGGEGGKNGMIAEKHQSIRNPFIGCCTFLLLCFCNKKSSAGKATTISRKKFIETFTKVFLNMFLMSFQRLEFSDDIQPMFVSVLTC